MIKSQKAYFLTEYQVATLNRMIGAKLGIIDCSPYHQLRKEERSELVFILHALTHASSITIERLMVENHQLRNRIQGLELEKAVNKLEKEEV